MGPLPLLPCLVGFAVGWLVWDRWLAQCGTMVVWVLFQWPFAAVAYLGHPFRSAIWWLTTGALFATSLCLTELGVRGRDRYQRLVRNRSARLF